MVKYISIDANIGCGKSTVIEMLKNISNDSTEIRVLREPVFIWEGIKNEESKNILQCYYEDPKKYAFAFQITALHSRKKIMREETESALEYEKSTGKNVIIITERTIMSDYHI